MFKILNRTEQFRKLYCKYTTINSYHSNSLTAGHQSFHWTEYAVFALVTKPKLLHLPSNCSVI